VPFVFPAGTRGSVSETLLMQYMQAAGSLVDEDGMPRIDPVALTDVLAFYADARAAGVIDPALFQITDLSESWTQYASRQAGLAVVSSTLYLSGRDQVRSTGVTWIPTLSGDPYALASGWSWAVTTRAAERQAAAMALVNFLMNPINQGAFTQAAGWLPSQAGALAVWGDSDPYTAFGDTMLRSAVPFPEAGPRAVIGAAIQDALEAVLLNGVTPFQAAAEAAQKVNPPVEEP
jgi:ABC-type glycerol-3-phosphate transport system substrate-binding protein